MQFAWITSIFGGIDKPKDIPEQTIPFKHYHFSEECNPKFLNGYNDRTKALYFKSQHHHVVKADYYIYTDGKIQVLRPDFIEQAINQLRNDSLAVLKHGSRKCIYEEIDFIETEIKKGNEYLTVRYADKGLKKQAEYYLSEGYPANNGLFDCCIFIRKGDELTNYLFDEWWRRCLNGFFDQTALAFTAWEHRINIEPLVFKPGSYKHVKHLVLK